MPARLCRHEPCRCEPKPGQEYCDPACAQADPASPPPAQGAGEARCPCGHPECRPGFAQEYDPEESDAVDDPSPP